MLKTIQIKKNCIKRSVLRPYLQAAVWNHSWNQVMYCQKLRKDKGYQQDTTQEDGQLSNYDPEPNKEN